MLSTIYALMMFLFGLAIATTNVNKSVSSADAFIGSNDISDYLGNPVEYYGGPVEDLLGQMVDVSSIKTEGVSSATLLKPRSITPYKRNDLPDFIKTTRATDGDPADYQESAISAAGSAVVTITQADLGESSVYSVIYASITVPRNFKGQHVITLALAATNKEGIAGETTAMRLMLKDDQDTLVVLTNYRAKNNTPQALNMHVNTAAARTIVVTALGLPDEAVLTVVAPGETDSVKLAYERAVLGIDTKKA
jgi:hypothetical protein